MINGKLEAGDVSFEVEYERWENKAPIVAPTMESMGGIKGLISNGLGWVLPNTSQTWMETSPVWQVDAPDAYGNRRWWLNSTMSKKVFATEGFGYNLEGTPGKYYTMSLDVRTYVTAMNGHPDYVPQPPCRFRLYATNGNEAQDVIIAESGVINPIIPEAPTWPFHPGYREWRLSLNAVQPMPVGKTYFRLQLEYDNDFMAVKEIWLPADYHYPEIPPNLNFFAVRTKSRVIYEHTGEDEAWKPSHTSPTSEYNWENSYVQYRGTTTTSHYWETEITVTPEDYIAERGLRVRYWSRWSESNLRVSVNAVDGDNTWHTYSFGNVGPGWYEKVWAPGTGPVFDENLEEQTLKLRFYSRSVEDALICAIGDDWDDFDGRTFYKYHDMTGWVTDINISRYDSEVSTCSVVLREDNSYYPVDYGDGFFDTGHYFDQGKRIRISVPDAYPGQTDSTYFGLAYSQYNTLFIGDIKNRKAKYPRKARKEVTVFATNKFPLLQEKTYWSLSNLEDYIRLIPSMGINSRYDSGSMVPWDRDPFMSLTGFGDVNDMWEIRDEANGFTMFDALQLTRNSQFGYVYFDRWDRLNLKSTLPSSVMMTFNDIPDDENEDSYADLDVSFDSSSIINSIRIREYQQVATIQEDTFEREDAIVETENTIFDLPSIKRYGKSEIEFKTFKKTVYDELRDHILDKHAEPSVFATRVIVPVRDITMAEKVILTDIYSLVAIKYQDRIDTQHRVNSIHHRIAPGKTWTVEFGFGINHDGVWW